MADIGISGALGAYQKINNLPQNQQIGGTAGGQFTRMVSDVIDTSTAAIRRGEQTAQLAVMDQVSIDELAVAVADADMALRTVVAVRDRLVSAYQDIMKMPI